MSMDLEVLQGLRVLAESAFPKKCASCGREFMSSEQYIKETVSINGKSGLKASEDDDGSSILEVYRNCPCGSTLMDFFQDRRDMSEKGAKRRQAFEKVLSYLMEQGLERAIARGELLKVLKNQRSEIFEEKDIKLK